MNTHIYSTNLRRMLKRIFSILLVLCMFQSSAPLLIAADAAYEKTGDQAEDIVAYAKTQIGIKQSGKCAYFITKCAKQAGMTGDQMKLTATGASPYSDVSSQFGYINASTGAFKYGCEAFTWKDFKDGTYQPRKGDLVFFGKLNGGGTANVTIQDIVKNYQGKWSHKHVALLIDDKSTMSKLYTINGGWDSSKENKSVGTYTFSPEASTGKVTSGLGGTYWVMEFVRPYYMKTNMNSNSVSASTTYNGHVYERYDYNLSWTDAKSFCAAKGGHLVTITDEAEQAAVVGLLNGCPMGFYHIGCSDMAQSGNWSWVNGEGFSYANWDSQAPEPTKGAGEYYGAIIGRAWNPNKQIGEWIDEQDNGGSGFYAFVNAGFICEFDNTSGSAYTPGNTITYAGKTYERYDYSMSWNSARSICEQMGGHLVTITDAAENNAVVSLLSGCPHGYYHIGGFDLTQQNAWSWVTGESFSYANWDPQAPEPTRKDGEFYAAIIGIDYPQNKQVGEWIDEPDVATATGFYGPSNNGFICEYEIRDTMPPVVTKAEVSNITATGYEVTCEATDDYGVTQFQIGTWNDIIGIDAAKWQVANASGNKAVFHVSVSDFQDIINTVYHTNVYAVDAAGNWSAAVRAGDPVIDTVLPGISNMMVTDVTSSGYTVTCTVTDNLGIASVKFPTWTLNNDQDDIANPWPEGVLSDGTATFRVNVSDHNGENGCTYRTHIYAYDLAGNYAMAGVDTEVPTSIQNSGWGFDSATGTLTISSQGSMPEYYGSGIDNRPWKEYLGSIQHVIITDDVTSICARAFEGCTSLKSVSMGHGLINIGELSFLGCSSLETLYIPDSVQTIAVTSEYQGPFYNCTGLKEISIGGVETITSGMFRTGSLKLEKMTIRGTVKTIAGSAFDSVVSYRYGSGWIGTNGYDCSVSHPSMLIIEEGVETIMWYAFNYCKMFTSISLPSTIKEIQTHAFTNCTGLTELIVPDTVEKVEENALAGIAGLKVYPYSAGLANASSESLSYSVIPYSNTMSLPSALNSVEEEAFKGIETEAVVFSGTISHIGTRAFADSKLHVCVFPDSEVIIDDSAFENCSGLRFACDRGSAAGQWAAAHGIPVVNCIRDY